MCLLFNCLPNYSLTVRNAIEEFRSKKKSNCSVGALLFATTQRNRVPVDEPKRAWELNWTDVNGIRVDFNAELTFPGPWLRRCCTASADPSFRVASQTKDRRRCSECRKSNREWPHLFFPERTNTKIHEEFQCPVHRKKHRWPKNRPGWRWWALKCLRSWPRWSTGRWRCPGRTCGTPLMSTWRWWRSAWRCRTFPAARKRQPESIGLQKQRPPLFHENRIHPSRT